MARESDPVVGYMFSIDANGIKGYFTEISGIGSEHKVVSQKVVQDGKEAEIKTAGRLEWTDITVKKGLTTDMAFWKWREMVVHGELDKARQPCTITMYDRSYKPIVTWNLINAWPSKISGISVKADSNDFVVEEMVITHEGIKREGAEGYPTMVK